MPTTANGQPVDHTEWKNTLLDTNAYYYSLFNELVLPAGYLQAPFFNPAADAAVNYGAIGAVMGHELAHSLHGRGRLYDAAGNRRSWWAPRDATRFAKRAQVVRRHYDSFAPLPELHVNGQLTLDENLADLVGLTIGYEALQKHLQQRYGSNPRPLYDGFTPEQRFFLSWAQLRRRNMRPEALRRQIQTDPHAPERYRIIGPLMNMPQFQAAFGCQKGDKMTRGKTNRVVVW